MKKFIPIIAATTVSGLIITGLFAGGILEYKQQQTQKKTIDLKGLAAQTSPQADSLTYIQHMQKGDEYAKKSMNDLAINEYMAANQQQPESTDPYMNIGKILFATHDYTRAQEMFQQLLTKNANNEEASLYLAQTLIMLRDPQKAQDLLVTLPESQVKSYYLGMLSSYFGKYDDAKNMLAAAIKTNTSPDVSAKAQKILSSFGEYGLNPGSQEIFLKTILSKNFNQVGEYTLSIPLLFNVVKEKKDYRDAWILLGYAYLNTDNNKDAIDALEQAKSLDANKPETLFFLGLAYNANNQKDLAVQYIEEAVNKGFEPKIQAQQKLAEIYLLQANYQKSAEKYEAVIALNDSDINYYIRPMWLYIEKLNQPAKALMLSQKAMAHHANSAMAFNLIGWAQLALNDVDNAKQSLAKSLQLDANLAAAYLNLGRLYEKTANVDTAKEYYKTAFKLGEGTSVGDSAGELYNQLVAMTSSSTATSQSLEANTLSIPATKSQTTTAPASQAQTQNVTPNFKLPENYQSSSSTQKLQPLENTP